MVSLNFSYQFQELRLAANKVISEAKDFDVIAFYGEMGTGKTTLITEICKQIGVEDHISSPTYSLVNEYQSLSGRQIFHFDFYRIEQEDEALDIGVMDYFRDGSLCFIEWPEKIANLLPYRHLEVKMAREEQTVRMDITPRGQE